MFLAICMVSIFVDLCASYDNSSFFAGKVETMGKSAFSSRQSKLISFNTLDDGISVDLDFTVPFITIPVKKSMALAQGSLINIDLGAIVLAGGLVVGISLFMPLVLAFFSKQKTLPSQWKPGHRRLLLRFIIKRALKKDEESHKSPDFTSVVLMIFWINMPFWEYLVK